MRPGHSHDRHKTPAADGTGRNRYRAAAWPRPGRCALTPRPNETGPWRLAGAGAEFAGAVLVFVGIGYLIDRGLGTHPWFLVVGALLGFAGGMYNLIKLARSQDR